MTEYNKAYSTAQAADYVELTAPTFRKYLRHLEEYYPYIQRDTESNYRIFNEYDLAVMKRMIEYTKRQGWTVKRAAEQAARDKEEIYEDLNAQGSVVDTEPNTLDIAGNNEALELLRGLYESNKVLHEDNKRLNKRINELTNEIRTIKEERQTLLEYDEDQEDGSNADQEEPVEDVEPSKEDEQQPESLSDYRTVEDKPKKKAGILSRLFGKS